MEKKLAQLLIKDKSQKKESKELFKKLKKLNTSNLDKLFHQEHESVFKKIDCLECANCCKTTSPIFRDADIERISKNLKIKSVNFIEKYLKIDEDNDYVLQSSPCVFLDEDNYCSIYSYRPLACREYPHTNRKKMIQILNLTEKNTEICPAVNLILNEIKQKI